MKFIDYNSCWLYGLCKMERVVPKKLLMKLFDYVFYDAEIDDIESFECYSMAPHYIDEIKDMLLHGLLHFSKNDGECFNFFLNSRFYAQLYIIFASNYDNHMWHDICGITSLPKLKLVYEVFTKNTDITQQTDIYLEIIRNNHFMALARILVVNDVPHPFFDKNGELFRNIVRGFGICIGKESTTQIRKCIVNIYNQICCRLIMAAWSDGRKRLREGMELREGSARLRIVEGLPRQGLAEIMKQMRIVR